MLGAVCKDKSPDTSVYSILKENDYEYAVVAGTIHYQLKHQINQTDDIDEVQVFVQGLIDSGKFTPAHQGTGAVILKIV